MEFGIHFAFGHEAMTGIIGGAGVGMLPMFTAVGCLTRAFGAVWQLEFWAHACV